MSAGGRTKNRVLASQRRRSPLRVVTPRRPESPRRLPFLIACFVFVGSLVVAVVSVQALVAQSSFQMQQVTRRNAVLAQAAGRLQLEIAQLSAPSRMAKEARKLGLRLPGPGQLHTLVVRGRP